MYQGYENYPTWVMAVWIDNDRKLLSMVRDIAGITADGPEEHEDLALADWLRAWVGSQLPESQGNNPSGSLLNHVMTEIDWIGLARKYLKGDD